VGWEQVDVDALRDREKDAVKRGLLDNYDDVEGYYNFQVRSHFLLLSIAPDCGDISSRRDQQACLTFARADNNTIWSAR
jgi:hypothetical protein